MTSYRFCRPDDMHLLIKAMNSCAELRSGLEGPFDVASYKTFASELDLWSSSCMVALERDADDVRAAIIGCKREDETNLLMLGEREDSRDKGHLQHMLNSMASKLAILGPPQISVEIPEDGNRFQALLEEAGYQQGGTLVDFASNQSSDALPQSSGRVPLESLNLSHVIELELFDLNLERAWNRQLRTLSNLGDSLYGVGIISESDIESYVLYREHEGSMEREILALGQRRADATLSLLLREILRDRNIEAIIPRASEHEFSFESVKQVGFKEIQRYQKMVLHCQ